MAGSMSRFESSPIIRHLGGSSFSMAKAARKISGLGFQCPPSVGVTVPNTCGSKPQAAIFRNCWVRSPLVTITLGMCWVGARNACV